jgi:hypothetical protein
MLAVAFHTIGTISDRLDVLGGAFNSIAGRQKHHGATESQHSKEFLHFLSPMLRTQWGFACMSMNSKREFEEVVPLSRHPAQWQPLELPLN